MNRSEPALSRLESAPQTRFHRPRLQIIARIMLLLMTAAFISEIARANVPAHPPRHRAEPPPIPGVEIVKIGAHRGRLDLAGNIYILEDPTAELTFEQIRSPELIDRFQLAQADGFNFGFSASAIWLRLDLEATPRTHPVWLLVFDYPLLDRLEIYDSDSPGNEPRQVLGDRMPFADRVVQHRQFAFPIPLARGGGFMRIYVRITSESSLQVHPSLIDGGTMFHSTVTAELLYGLVYGVFFLMAIYNLFLFLEMRDFSYLAYVFVLIFGGGFVMALNGHAFQYVWPSSPNLANLMNPAFAALWLFATACFARLFLEPKKYEKRVIPVLNAMITVGVFVTLVALLGEYRTAMRLASVAAALNGIVLFACGTVVWVRGNRSARFFTIAWAGLGVGVSILALSRFGLLPDSEFTRHGAMVGGVLEAILLSLALSDRFRIVNVELESYSRELETMVAARTSKLQTANRELQRLSRVDPLTGVANRRSFDQSLAQEISRARREKHSLSLLLIDVDHFKQVNDEFGHPVGDDVLRQVASTLADVARRPSDLPARYGGEEFAVVLANTDAVGASNMAESICTAVRRRIFAGSNGNPLPLTVSVGASSATAGDRFELESLLHRADNALYRAKREGRNRVCVAEHGHQIRPHSNESSSSAAVSSGRSS